MSEGKTTATQQSATIEKLHDLFAQITPQEVETFYQGFQVWQAQQKAAKLRVQIAELRSQLAVNTERMQQCQPSALALSALALLQSHNVASIELLEHMLDRGDEWLNHTLQLLTRCEELDVIQGDYTKWCENALDGAYDWIDTMDQASTEAENTTIFDETTENLLLQKLLSDDDERTIEPAQAIATEQAVTELAEAVEPGAVEAEEYTEEADSSATVTPVETVESVEKSEIALAEPEAVLAETVSQPQEQTAIEKPVEEPEEVTEVEAALDIEPLSEVEATQEIKPLVTEADVVDLPQEELQTAAEEPITVNQDEIEDRTEVEQGTEEATTDVEIAEPAAVTEEPEEINEAVAQPDEAISESAAGQSEEETTSIAAQPDNEKDEAEEEIIPFVDSSEFEAVEQTIDLVYTLEEEQQPVEQASKIETEPVTTDQSVEQAGETTTGAEEEREGGEDPAAQQPEEIEYRQPRITQPLVAQAHITQPLEMPEEQTDVPTDEDGEEPAQTEKEWVAGISEIDTVEMAAIQRIEQAEIQQDSVEHESVTTADNTKPSAEETGESALEEAKKLESQLQETIEAAKKLESQLQEAMAPETPLPEEDVTLRLLPKVMPLHLEDEHTEHMPALVRAYMLYSLEQQAAKDKGEEQPLPMPSGHVEMIVDDPEAEQEISSSSAHAETVVDHPEEERNEQKEPVQKKVQPYEQVLFEVLEDDLLPAPTMQPTNGMPVTPIFSDPEPVQVQTAREIETPLPTQEPRKKRGLLAFFASLFHKK